MANRFSFIILTIIISVFICVNCFYEYNIAKNICKKNNYNLIGTGRICIFELRDCWKFEYKTINLCDNIKYNVKYIINSKQNKE